MPGSKRHNAYFEVHPFIWIRREHPNLIVDVFKALRRAAGAELAGDFGNLLVMPADERSSFILFCKERAELFAELLDVVVGYSGVDVQLSRCGQRRDSFHRTIAL